MKILEIYGVNLEKIVWKWKDINNWWIISIGQGNYEACVEILCAFEEILKFFSFLEKSEIFWWKSCFLTSEALLTLPKVFQWLAWFSFYECSILFLPLWNMSHVSWTAGHIWLAFQFLGYSFDNRKGCGGWSPPHISIYKIQPFPPIFK